MNALQKKGGNASAAAAAAASLAYQHQLQMQATYERVLKVSRSFQLTTYIDDTNGLVAGEDLLEVQQGSAGISRVVLFECFYAVDS